MDWKDIIEDALGYPFSDFKLVILLGLVYVLADLTNQVPGNDLNSAVIMLILVFVILLLSIVEAGYIFKVVEDTVHGSDTLPKLSNLKRIFLHGIKEIIVTTIYLLIPMFLLIISYLFVNTSNSNYMYIYLGYAVLIVVTIIILLFGFILQVVILNMAHHQGSVRSGFRLQEIRRRMGQIGYKNLLFSYILVSITFGSLILFLSDMIKSIPLIGTLVLLLFIEPYLLIFTSRVLGLVDRP